MEKIAWECPVCWRVNAPWVEWCSGPHSGIAFSSGSRQDELDQSQEPNQSSKRVEEGKRKR